MLHHTFRNKILFLGLLMFSMLFSVSVVYAGNPVTPILPSDNIQDPGDPGTAWGGCGPTDSNCYVTVTSSQWVTTGSDIYYNTGNVGIGNSTPTAKLDILLGAAQANAFNIQGPSSANYFRVNAIASNIIAIGSSTTGSGATSASNSNFIGPAVASGATSASNSNFFGLSTGQNATGANNSNFFGYVAGSGATSASFSNFFGNTAGYNATDAFYSNFIGSSAGEGATSAARSNFFGRNAGSGATNAANSNIIGYGAGKTFTGNNIGANNIIIGSNVSLPDATADAINIGGILFGTGAYSTLSGDASIAPVSGGRIGIGTVSPSSKLDVTTTSLGTTQTETSGLALVNTTAASVGAQQISPAVRWSGNGWKTNATAGSQAVDFRSYVLPVQGTTNPTGRWLLEASINGGAYSERFGIGNSGQVFLGGNAGSVGQALMSAGSNSAALWTSLSAIATSGLTNGSGTTATGTAVYLGGNLLGDVSINYNGMYDFIYQGNRSGIAILDSDTKTQIGDVGLLEDRNIFTVDDAASAAYFDNTLHTGFFGININAPTVPLDVLGNVLFTTNDGSNSSFIIYNSDDAANMLKINPADGFIIFDEGGNGYNVGIANATPSVELDVTGDIEYTGDITDVSDERLKENITNFGSGLSVINAVGVKNYNMIVTPNKPETGFIAQNIKEIFPQSVSIVDPVNGYMGVSYVSFIPVLTKAVQELDLKITGIENFDQENNSFGDKLRTWFANASNRITRIFTGEICLTDLDGVSECINKTQLGQLKQLLNNTNTSNGDDTPPPPPDPVDPPKEDPTLDPEPTVEPVPDQNPPSEEIPEQTPPSETTTP